MSEDVACMSSSMWPGSGSEHGGGHGCACASLGMYWVLVRSLEEVGYDCTVGRLLFGVSVTRQVVGLIIEVVSEDESMIGEARAMLTLNHEVMVATFLWMRVLMGGGRH